VKPWEVEHFSVLVSLWNAEAKRLRGEAKLIRRARELFELETSEFVLVCRKEDAAHGYSICADMLRQSLTNCLKLNEKISGETPP